MSQGAIAGHPVSPGSTPQGTHVTSGSGSETLANLSPGARKHVSSICGVQCPFLTCMLHQCQQPQNNFHFGENPVWVPERPARLSSFAAGRGMQTGSASQPGMHH